MKNKLSKLLSYFQLKINITKIYFYFPEFTSGRSSHLVNLLGYFGYLLRESQLRISCPIYCAIFNVDNTSDEEEYEKTVENPKKRKKGRSFCPLLPLYVMAQEIVSGRGGGAQVLFVCHLKIQEKKSLLSKKWLKLKFEIVNFAKIYPRQIFQFLL